MNKKIITACAAALLMAACAGAWLAYHHANPKTDRLEFEYGDPLDIEAKTLIRSPNPAIADTVEIDLSAIEREEDGTAAAGSWDASFTYTDVFGTHTCPLTICISDTAAPSFLKLPERITLAPGNADHDFSANIEIWDLSECSLEIDSSMVDFDQPGEYILFATAVDRYDNQRSRSIRLTISEAQDTPTFIASSEAVTDIDPVLQRMVEAYLSARAGGQEHWSLMVMDAENAAAIVSVNSAVQQSASLMKLFVMGAVYDRYDSLRNRQNDADKSRKFVGSVYTGGFQYPVGDIRFEECFRHEHVPHAQRGGHDQRPSRIHPTQTRNDQIERDQSAAEKHRDDEQPQKELFEPHVRAAEPVSRRNRNHQTDRRAGNGIDDGIQITVPNFIILKQSYESGKCNSPRIKQHLSVHHHIRIGKRRNDQKIKRIYDYQRQKRQNCSVDNVVNGIAVKFEFPLFSRTL